MLNYSNILLLLLLLFILLKNHSIDYYRYLFFETFIQFVETTKEAAKKKKKKKEGKEKRESKRLLHRISSSRRGKARDRIRKAKTRGRKGPRGIILMVKVCGELLVEVVHHPSCSIDGAFFDKEFLHAF
jgi:hypothetical protein